MEASKYCKHCGNGLEANTQFCSKCGAKIEENHSSPLPPSLTQSQKSPILVLILCVLLGVFGVHRFYVGKNGSGSLMLLTLGGLGIWLLVDLILIVSNKFDDAKGNRIELTQNPSSFKKTTMIIGAIVAWFLLFVGVIFAFVLFLTSGLIYSIDQQLSALQSGNMEKAYSYTSKDFQKATSLSEFKKFIDQYPSLKNNESSFFNERVIENNVGIVKGTLTAKDGAKTPITYRLIWEDGKWKILNISVSYTGAGIEINHRENSSSNTKASPNKSQTSPSNTTWKVLENSNNKYSVNYPVDWEAIKTGKGTYVFRGKKDTPSYGASISIQTLLTKKNKGKYATIQEIKDDLKSQIFKSTTHAQIVNEGEIELPQNPKQYKGEYIIFTYQYKNKEMKQMYVFFLRTDQLAFYTWTYAAPLKQYDANLPITKSMYESWTIK